jgi:NADPH:quinone reductase-like Zn-dependent oxidoreductase
MYAVRFHEHGKPEKLIYEKCPVPILESNQALIEVKACALNRLDLWVRQGVPAYPVELPHISGSDIAGVIKEGDGLESQGLKPGDEVVVYPGVSCGQCSACTEGLENRCPSFKIIGAHLPGGYAQLVKVPIKNLFKKPVNLSWAEAAAYPLTFVTAWHMLTARAQVKEGETVLIQGASSGVGTAAVQIARYLECHVIAVTSSPEKEVKLKELGAHEVISGAPKDIGAKIKESTHNLGADVVLEHVGPATWDESFKALRAGGKMVICGATTGPAVELVLRSLFSREITLLGSMLGTMDEFKRVSRLVANGSFKPVIDKMFPLEKARKAQELLVTKNHVGKIVLEVEQ